MNSEYFSSLLKSLSNLDDDQGKLLIIAAYSASLSTLPVIYFAGITIAAEYYQNKALNAELAGKYVTTVNYGEQSVNLKEGVSTYHDFPARNYSRRAHSSADTGARRRLLMKSEKEFLRMIELSPTVAPYYMNLANLML